jgi:hypothetical protein
MLKFSVGAPGFIHCTHAAVPNFALNAIGTDVAAQHRLFVGAAGRLGIEGISYFGRKLTH